MHGSPEPSLLVDGISTNILCAGPYFVGRVLFDLILYVPSTIFQLLGTGLPGLNQN